MTADALGTGDRMPEGQGGAVMADALCRARRASSARAAREQVPLQGFAGGARPHADGPVPEGRLAALDAENEALGAKLSRLSRAIHGLASDLAASRRECRRQLLEIKALREENAALRGERRAAA